MKSTDIAFVAGLLEGEGCFDLKDDKNSPRKYPRISLEMKDRDIIERISRLFNSPIFTKEDRRYGSFTYRTTIQGYKAIQWMMTIYTLLGTRRKRSIRQIIDTWKATLYPRDMYRV